MMMRFPRPSLPCVLIALSAGFLPSAVGRLCAQEAGRDAADPGRVTGNAVGERDTSGPARARLNASAATLAVDPPPSPVWMLGRFHTFQRELSADFGEASTGLLDRDDAMANLNGEIAARWGGTRWYDWLRRGLALYARLESLTETERSGFDMEVKMDDLPEGKLGVRVNRALE